MSTKSVFLIALATGSFAATAHAFADVPVDLSGGRHLRIISAYLTADTDKTRVRGMVRRDPLWHGPVDGHLHVIAYGPDGRPIARAATVWSRFDRDTGVRPYVTDLDVPRSDVARLSVSWAPGAHKASEAFE